jgi:hypothetical protein
MRAERDVEQLDRVAPGTLRSGEYVARHVFC